MKKKLILAAAFTFVLPINLAFASVNKPHSVSEQSLPAEISLPGSIVQDVTQKLQDKIDTDFNVLLDSMQTSPKLQAQQTLSKPTSVAAAS